ncbi:MAG: glutathione S-transferase family protein [Candidatus Binatia bacterium]
MTTDHRYAVPAGDLVLHHYWMSPYAEKVRCILGFKRLSWKSVLIPIVMPKPDLLALTGGYRKTPVLQIGADVFCDTDLIARVLDAVQPDPPLFPDGTEGLCYALGAWQQQLFALAVEMLGLGGAPLPDNFVEDRTKMFEGGLDVGRMVQELPAKRDQLRAKLDILERQLGAGRPFVLGERPSLADFSLYHPIFALRSLPAMAVTLEPFSGVLAWADRIAGFGHGTWQDMSSAAAVEIARAATPQTSPSPDPADPNGRLPGERLSVVHADFGRDPVVGELVASSVHEIAMRRRDERAGEVIVHLPRERYVVLPA